MGSVFILRTYCVEIETVIPSCEIELQTLDSNSSMWKSRGISTVRDDNTICWDEIFLEENGVVSYRFVCGSYVSEIYSGPVITAIEI